MSGHGFNTSSKLSASQIRALRRLAAGRVLRECTAPNGFIRHELDGATVQAPIVKSLRYHYWIREQSPGVWEITGRGRAALEKCHPKAPAGEACETRPAEAAPAPANGATA